MTTINASKARAELHRLLEQVAETHEPVRIAGRRGNAVLVSEDDWCSIQETLHVISIPGMRESVIERMETPVEECADDFDW